MLTISDVSSNGNDLDLAILVRCYTCGVWIHLECASLITPPACQDKAIVCQGCEGNAD